MEWMNFYPNRIGRNKSTSVRWWWKSALPRLYPSMHRSVTIRSMYNEVNRINVPHHWLISSLCSSSNREKEGEKYIDEGKACVNIYFYQSGHIVLTKNWTAIVVDFSRRENEGTTYSRCFWKKSLEDLCSNHRIPCRSHLFLQNKLHLFGNIPRLFYFFNKTDLLSTSILRVKNVVCCDSK